MSSEQTFLRHFQRSIPILRLSVFLQFGVEWAKLFVYFLLFVARHRPKFDLKEATRETDLYWFHQTVKTTILDWLSVPLDSFDYDFLANSCSHLSNVDCVQRQSVALVHVYCRRRLDPVELEDDDVVAKQHVVVPNVLEQLRDSRRIDRDDDELDPLRRRHRCPRLSSDDDSDPVVLPTSLKTSLERTRVGVELISLPILVLL